MAFDNKIMPTNQGFLAIDHLLQVVFIGLTQSVWVQILIPFNAWIDFHNEIITRNQNLI